LPRFIIRDVASSLPFTDDSGVFTSKNTKDAIFEALNTSVSLPRFPVILVMNGTVSNGDWITYSNLTPSASIIIPTKCELRELTWSNRNSSVEFDLEFYKNGRATTAYETREVRSGSATNGQFTGLDDSFDALDTLDIKYIDQGSNASDLVLVIFFQTVL